MTRPSPASTPVATSKTAALARVLDLVPKGYTFHVSGQCPAGKALKLARKFHARYGIGCSPAQRLLRKQRGLANAQLVLYWPSFEAPTAHTIGRAHEHLGDAAGDADSAAAAAPAMETQTSDGEVHAVAHGEALVEWLLLVTPGTGRVADEEALKSVTAMPRLTWLGYELIRHAVRGKTSWTWRRPKTDMREWHALLSAQLATHKTTAVAQTLSILARQPGFSGIRSQTLSLFAFARQHGYRANLPVVFFVQKQVAGQRVLV